MRPGWRQETWHVTKNVLQAFQGEASVDFVPGEVRATLAFLLHSQDKLRATFQTYVVAVGT